MTAPICRWITVPNVTHAEPFHVGVSAWHIDGIERVEWTVNGEEWGTNTEPSVNDGVWGWWVLIDPDASSPDGLLDIEFRALARNGTYRTGQTAHRNALALPTAAEVAYCSPDGDDRADGTPARPCATPSGALRAVTERYGGTLRVPLTIRLYAGFYDIGGKFWDPNQSPARGDCPDHWVTVEPDPSVEPVGVWINAGDGGVTGANWVRWRGVGLDTHNGLRLTSRRLWLDGCKIIGPMDTSATYLFKKPWSDSVYITGCRASYRYGFSGADLVVGSTIDVCGKSALAQVPAVFNCTVDGFENTGGHGSCLKWLLTDQNPIGRDIIWQGVRAPNYPMQGLHIEDNTIEQAGRVEGLVLADSIIRRRVPMNTPGTSWVEAPIDHAIIDGLDLGDQSLTFTGRGIMHSARVRGCTFARWSGQHGLGGNAYADHNRWTDVRGYGAYRVGSDPRPGWRHPCDVTTTNTNPGDPLYGIPDGIVDGADQSHYVEKWLDSQR